MNSIQELIEKIREEERIKILKEIEVNQKEEDPWKIISGYIEEWGEDNAISPWVLNKIKNSIYTVIRFSLDIKRMAQLRREQLEIALDITDEILNMISPIN